MIKASPSVRTTNHGGGGGGGDNGGMEAGGWADVCVFDLGPALDAGFYLPLLKNDLGVVAAHIDVNVSRLETRLAGGHAHRCRQGPLHYARVARPGRARTSAGEG